MLMRLHSHLRRIILVAATILAIGAQAAAPEDKVTSAGGRAGLELKAQQSGKVKIIVTLNLPRPFRPAGYLPPSSRRHSAMRSPKRSHS
jgi:hypothetical protein